MVDTATASQTRRRPKAVDRRVLTTARERLEEKNMRAAAALLPADASHADVWQLSQELRRLDLRKAGLISGIIRRAKRTQQLSTFRPVVVENVTADVAATAHAAATGSPLTDGCKEESGNGLPNSRRR